MSEHTPGPWEAMRLITNGRMAVVVDPADARGMKDLIAEVALAENEEANARLIAAAPELADALEDFLEHYEHLSNIADPGGPVWTIENEPFVIKARAAIAKARGQAVRS